MTTKTTRIILLVVALLTISLNTFSTDQPLNYQDQYDFDSNDDYEFDEDYDFDENDSDYEDSFDKYKLSIQILPTFDIDFSSYRYVINEAPYEYFDQTKKVEGIKNDTITLPVVEDEGYRVINSRYITIGFGAEISMWFNNLKKELSWLSVNLGVMPIRSSGIRSEVWIDELADVPTAYIDHIPANANEIRDWYPGDKVTYHSEGGIVSYANLNYFIALSLNSLYVAEGGWVNEVKRLADNRVSLEITNNSLRSFKHSANFAFAVEVAKERFKEIETTFKFIYDLDDEVARNAYTDALRGNLLPSQKMALDNHDERVSYDHENKAVSTTTMRSKSLHIPLLPFVARKKWANGRTYSKAFTTYHESKEIVHANYVTHFNNIDSNRVGRYTRKDVKNRRAFTAVTYETVRSKKMIDYGKMAFFNWHYRNSKTKKSEFRGMLTNMANYVGMKDKMKIAIPSYKNFGYVGIMLDVAFHENALRKIAKKISFNPNAIADLSLSKAKKYFSVGSDPLNICEGSPLDSCQTNTIKFIQKNAKELALQVSQAINLRKDKFTKKMRSICQKTISNRFMLQALIALAPQRTVIKYTVEGKLFPRYVRYFNGNGKDVEEDIVIYDRDQRDLD